MNEYKLNTDWVLWYHSINDNNWTNSSYKKIEEIHNLYDLKLILDNIQSNHLQNGMFFIMRNDIFPTWEYPDNREGCSISFKVPASQLKQNLDLLITKTLTEDILKDKDKYNEINGLSISPKKEFNIIKLWLKNNTEDYESFIKEYSPYFIKSKSIHKKHLN
jgi:hypothetical protein